MKYTIYTYLFLLFAIIRLSAQKLNVQVSTTKPVVGVPFEISFSTNASIQDFTPPSFSNFEVISGPNHSQNIQFINGSLSQSSSISYVLIPKKEGAVVINAAKAIINNQTVYSSPITLDVQKNNNSNYNASANTSGNSSEPISANVNKDDIFVRTFINKKQCYVGEQITLTQKIYTRVELRGIQNVKFPHLEGFWTKNQENTGNIQLHIENIDGINYYVGEISTQYLFPQKTGKLTISPIEIDCVIRKRVNRAPRDIFEQFFGVNAFEDKVVTIKSHPVSISVNDLPPQNKPAGFSGAVGTNFSFKAEINRNKVKANDAINLKITISGTGNIPLIDAPKISFPAEFETYDPKVSENISTANGISGTKTYEYLIIPRQAGNYKLSDIQFSYFNLNSKQYVTLPTPEILIEVAESPNNQNNTAQIYQQFKQEIPSEDNDIHFIKPYPYQVSHKQNPFFHSPAHITLFLLPYLAMIGLFGFYQYRKNERADLPAFLQKRAQKIALKHLQTAEKLMKENQSEAFYTAITQAIENYIIYRFKINKSDLSKDKINELFNSHRIPENLKNQYFEIMNTCEMAKYAPVHTDHSLSKIFSDTKNLIIDIEKHIKNA
ncbi:MAG: BatD family protein [Bacteroidia bacterium]